MSDERDDHIFVTLNRERWLKELKRIDLLEKVLLEFFDKHNYKYYVKKLKNKED